MKYSVNHFWKFKYGGLAYTSGVLQVLSAVLIAVINYAVITASENVLDLAKDFTALIIIAEIDDQFANLSKEESVKDALEKPEYSTLFKIETTTSVDAWRRANQCLEPDPANQLLNERIQFDNQKIRDKKSGYEEMQEKE